MNKISILLLAVFICSYVHSQQHLSLTDIMEGYTGTIR